VTSSNLLVLPVRRGRNAFALVLLLVLTGLALYVANEQRDSLGLGHWWFAVFPLLALVTAYRQVRPRVPMAVDADGVHVVTGLPVLGLRATFDWASIKRMRVTASGLLLVELKNTERWIEDRPWLVRANVRANERRMNAAVIQPLRELAAHPSHIIEQLRAAAPVRLEAPEGLRV
jgi:hypothetical protein